MLKLGRLGPLEGLGLLHWAHIPPPSRNGGFSGLRMRSKSNSSFGYGPIFQRCFRPQSCFH